MREEELEVGSVASEVQEEDLVKGDQGVETEAPAVEEAMVRAATATESQAGLGVA